MGKSNVKEPSIDLNAFQRDFLKKFSEPLIKKLELAKTKADVPELIIQQSTEIKDVLQEEFPTLVWGWIQNEERMTMKTGAMKLAGVLAKLAQWVTNKGYGKYLPLFIPMIEAAVRMIYVGKIQSIFDILGIDDDFEKWMGVSIPAPITPVTPPVTPVAGSINPTAAPVKP